MQLSYGSWFVFPSKFWKLIMITNMQTLLQFSWMSIPTGYMRQWTIIRLDANKCESSCSKVRKNAIYMKNSKIWMRQLFYHMLKHSDCDVSRYGVHCLYQRDIRTCNAMIHARCAYQYILNHAVLKCANERAIWMLHRNHIERMTANSPRF